MEDIETFEERVKMMTKVKDFINYYKNWKWIYSRLESKKLLKI